MAARPPLLLLGLLLVAAAPGTAAPPVDPPEAAARVQAAARVRAADEAVSAAAQRVADLAERQRLAEQRLGERAMELAPLLPLAERLSLFPAETMLAVPVPPDQAMRGLSVLQGLTQTIERQAAGLRAELAAVDAAQRALGAELPRLRAAQAEQLLQAAQLDRQIEAARAERERARVDDAAADEARRAAAEATKADSVSAALDTMAASREKAEQLLKQDAERATRQRRTAALALAEQRAAQIAAPRGPGVQPGGGAVLPVAGPVVRRWGEQTEAGPARGMAFRASPSGHVVAPCAGRVAFAGPFRSYGVLVILDCGGNYHFVLAGLDKLDTEAGAAVRSGEAVGVMPDWDPATAGPRPSLYVELRHGGRAVDPAPFLRPQS